LIHFYKRYRTFYKLIIMAEDDVDTNFDLSAKKKKKKKKTPFDPDGGEAEEEAPATVAEDEPVKKEKKEKKVDFEADDSVDVDNIDLESFGKKKKKKKSRGEGLDNLDDVKESLPDEKEKGDDDDDDMDLGLDSLKKIKKKKKTRKNLDDLDDLDEDKENAGEEAGSDPWSGSDRDYQYDELLQRVFGIMRDKNPEMGTGKTKKFVMRPPQVVKVGTKKTAFANFIEIAKMLHRQPKHLLQFLFAELGTSGAIDGNNQLIIKGRFQQKHIENVLRRYIKEYVTCHTCRSPDTILNKETRLFFLQCMTCHSSCSVQTIKTGFQAITGKRKKIN